MNNNLFILAKEVVENLQVSDFYAYRLIRRLNKELEKKGMKLLRGKLAVSYVLVNKKSCFMK